MSGQEMFGGTFTKAHSSCHLRPTEVETSMGNVSETKRAPAVFTLLCVA
jgi:hypothetical protein